MHRLDKETFMMNAFLHSDIICDIRFSPVFLVYTLCSNVMLPIKIKNFYLNHLKL